MTERLHRRAGINSYTGVPQESRRGDFARVFNVKTSVRLCDTLCIKHEYTFHVEKKKKKRRNVLRRVPKTRKSQFETTDELTRPYSRMHI